MKRFKQVQLYLVLFLHIMFVNAAFASTVLKPNYPEQYIVKKGDTLWDIAGVFLNNPWLWPKLWEENKQIANPHLIYPNDTIYLVFRNGQPYLTNQKPGIVKLRPKIRDASQTPIQAIPDSALKSFIKDHRIVDEARVKKMPYIIAGAGLSSMIARGDEVFIRGALDSEYLYYDVYRPGGVYGSKFDLPTDNLEIIKIATLKLKTDNNHSVDNEVSRAVVVSSTGLVKPGDIVVRHNALELKPFYFMANAPADLSGKVIGAVESGRSIAKYDGLVVNLGKANAVYPGHIFDILEKPYKIKDPRSNQLVEIADQVIGKAMLVNVFENISYAKVLSSSSPIPLGSILKAPH